MMGRLLILCIFATAVSCGTWRSGVPPQLIPEGLQLVKSDHFSEVYVRPNHDFSVYDSIHIAQPEITFARGWQASQNISDPLRVTDRDVERIKHIMSTNMLGIVTEELAGGTAYKIVDGPVAGSLSVRPRILDLYINAPDVPDPYQITVLAQNVGKMTIVLEVRDTDTNALLLRTIDKKNVRDFPDFRQQDSVTNRFGSSRVLRAWAQSVTGLLNETSS